MFPSKQSYQYDEKTEVKAGLQAPLLEKDIWLPIATKWFEKWESYVGYEGANKQMYHPGPIDNADLQGSYGDELRRGMVEGLDYVLLPKRIADKLVHAYGGGPLYPRQVFKSDTAANYNQLYVSLYPTRFEVYNCNKNNKYVDKSKKDCFMIRYFSTNIALEKAIEDLKKNFGQFNCSERCWIKENKENVISIMSQGEDENVSLEEESFRFLTADVTEWDTDGWRLVSEREYSTGVREILGANKDCIEMILESTTMSMPKDHLWPRYMLLNTWKNYLRVGDYIDCQLSSQQELALEINKQTSYSSSACWYEGQVKNIVKENNQTKVMIQILVPSCNTAEQCIQYILPAQYDALKPLHKKTDDRTLWEEETAVDVFVGDWLEGKIIRREGLKVCVEYRKVAAEEVDDDTRKRSRTSSASSMHDIDEDIPLFSASSTAPTTASQWFFLYDAKLASAHTYTEVPIVTPTMSVATYKPSTFSAYSSSYGSYGSYDRHTAGKPSVAGAVGLQNLGNTCFLNSILQCLSNTKPLTTFFLHSDYKKLINFDNPLGTGGKVVKAYGHLLTDIWSGEYIKAVPREIKQIIGDLHPSFSGYEQQDAQECLSFLIDAIHEDCNQILKKPFVQKIESNGRADSLIASESWRRFLLRNDSFIIDQCFGQMRSHVTCTSCQKESITFDEYATLSLPIPLNTKKEVEVMVQFIGMLRPVKIVLEVEMAQCMRDFRGLLIAKLKELGLLLSRLSNNHDNDSSQVSLVSMNTTHSTTTNGEEETIEDSFEMVPPTSTTPSPMISNSNSPMEEDESYELVTNPTTNSTPDLVSPVVTADETIVSEASNIASEHFHLATFSSTRCHNLSKEYNDKDNGKVAITVFGNTRFDQFIAFQLAYPVPDPASSVISYYRSPMITSLAPPAPASPFHTINLAIGKVASLPSSNLPLTSTKVFADATDDPLESLLFPEPPTAAAAATPVYMTNTYNTNRIDFQSFLYHHSFSDSDHMTNASLYALARQLLSPFLTTTNTNSSNYQSKYGDLLGGWEYRLYITTSLGVIQKLIPNTQEVFEYDKVLSDSTSNMIGVTILPYPSSSIPAQSHQQAFQWARMCQTVEVEEYLASQPILKHTATTNNTNTTLLPHIGPKEITIYDCLNKFIEREQLAETETIYCSACQQHLPPIKKLDLYSVPDILIIQLKRFQFVPGQYFIHREKINEIIHFPIEGLDLRNYVLGYGQQPQSAGNGEDPENLLYDLYAVSHHMGGLGGGHYTATCKNFLNNKWYYFNDSMVTETTPETAVNGTAYVLFYQRRHGALKWGGIKPLPEGLSDEVPPTK